MICFLRAGWSADESPVVDERVENDKGIIFSVMFLLDFNELVLNHKSVLMLILAGLGR